MMASIAQPLRSLVTMNIEINRRNWVTLVILGSLGAQGQAQNTHGIGRIVVPFAPGGAREYPARAIYQEMAQRLDEHWIIESHQGAGGAIGTVFVSKSEPDGKTLLMAASSHFITAALGAKPTYDPIKEFVPVANIGMQSYVLMMSTSLPAKNLGEFIAHVKKHPAELNYSSAGIGSSTHLAMAYFCKAVGIDMLHVPYKGTQEAANDVLAARAHAVIVPTAGAGVYLQDPRIKALGITSKKRSSLRPEIPCINETGPKDFSFESWFGLLAPAATPKATVERLNQAINAAIREENVTKRLLLQGIEPSHLSTEEFKVLFTADHELMTKLVKDVGLINT
jgi:tripartite-type tricarboxylate transporter receptor subunit TctC